MNVITGIHASVRHPERFELLVDGACVATLCLDAIERLGLVVGGSVAGLDDRIAAESAQLKVYIRALGMIAFRARSSAELARSLVRKGEARVHVDRAVAQLQDQGLLDDAAFAQSFTRAKVFGAGHSRRRVEQDLARKGVARDVSAQAIETVFEDEGIDQRAIVERAARKKLRLLASFDPVVRRRRLYAFLARRGYDADDIRRAMDVVAVELRADIGSDE